MTNASEPTGIHIVFHRYAFGPYDEGGRQQRIQAVLLYKRTQDAPIHPGYWALLGGRVDERDGDDVAALKRELIHEKELMVEDLSNSDYEIILENAQQVREN